MDEGIIRTFGFRGKENPASQHAADIARTTDEAREHIRRAVRASGWHRCAPQEVAALSDNALMPALDVPGFLVKRRTLLQRGLDALAAESGHKPVLLVRDSCVTNDLLERSLRDAVGGARNFERFIEVRHVDWERPDHGMEALPNDCVVVLGGSFSDTYAIPPRLQQSDFYQSLLRTAQTAQYDPAEHRRVIGVCLGGQLLTDVLGAAQDVPCANVKGEAQFGPFNMRPVLSGSTPETLVNALSGIVDRDERHDFTAWMTRTGHPSFNLRDDDEDRGAPICRLVRDVSSGRAVVWGTHNAKLLGVQPHFEIRAEDLPRVRAALATPDVIASLTASYGAEIGRILDYFPPKWRANPPADADQAFYVPALLAMVQDVLEGRHASRIRPSVGQQPGYAEARQRLLAEVRVGMRSGMATNQEIDFGVNRHLTLRALIGNGTMKTRDLDDWRVDRGVEEVSRVLGVADLNAFVKSWLALRERLGISGTTSFVDAGAGDGTLISEVEAERPKDSNLLVYGSGDYVYFDILPGIRQMEEAQGVPDDFLMVFVQRALETYKHATGTARTFPDGLSGLEKKDPLDPEGNLDFLRRALWSTKVSEHSRLILSGMFEHEDERPMDDASRAFAASAEGQARLALLKKSLLTAPDQDGSYPEGKEFEPDGARWYEEASVRRALRVVDTKRYFERIWPGDFRAFQVPEKIVVPVGIKVASRSTSHIPADALQETILTHLESQADALGVFFENGLHESYTNYRRLDEVLAAVKKAGPQAACRLILDTATNYVRCAVILRETRPELDELVRASVAPGCILVDEPSLVANSTFFRLESFLRRVACDSLVKRSSFKELNKCVVEAVDFFLKKSHEHRGWTFPKEVEEEIVARILGVVHAAEKINRVENPGTGPVRRGEEAAGTFTRKQLFARTDQVGESLGAILGSAVSFPEGVLNENAVRAY